MRADIKLIKGDCMDLMHNTPDKYYELAICDPPYRDLKDNQPTKDMRNTGKIDCFGDKPTKQYFNELFRISKNQIIWGANNFELPSHKGFIIWEKLSIPEKFTMSMAEYAYISEDLGTVSKIFKYIPQDKNRIHLTQKPVALYKWLLTNYAKEGDKILDTHLGSGSIAIACWDLGFDLTGIEIDEEYYNAAVKRFNWHKSQEQMF